MSDIDDERLLQDPILRLKAALQAACGRISEQLQSEKNVNIDKKVVAAISDITFQQISTFTQDLEAFARHGKRTTINVDDVRLLCRRNPGLLDETQRSLKPVKSSNKSNSTRNYSSSRYDDHNVDITTVESSSDIDEIV